MTLEVEIADVVRALEQPFRACAKRWFAGRV